LFGGGSDEDVAAGSLNGQVLRTASKVKLTVPVDTGSVEPDNNCFVLSFDYWGTGVNTNSVRFWLYDISGRLLVKSTFDFNPLSGAASEQLAEKTEVSIPMTNSRLLEITTMEIILASSGGEAGLKNMTYAFTAHVENPGGETGDPETGSGEDETVTPGGETGDETPDTGVKVLRVNGNRLEYGSGDSWVEAVLRGVNVGDLYHFKKYGIKAPDFSYIANTMNANAVRMAVHPSLWISENDRVVNLAFLKENVQKALAAGLFVIIDYHTIGFPDSYVQPLPGGDIAYSGDFSLARSFWDTISKEITDPRVLYELWNEPVAAASSLSDTSKWTVLKGYWEQLIKIIRDNGCGNVIIAAGDYWAYNLKRVKNSLLADANTAYAWHIYGGHGGNDAQAWENALDGLNEVKPVLVTEWGFSLDPKEYEYASTGDFADKFVSRFLTAKNLSSFAWGYDPWYTPSMLKGNSYTNFSDYGKYVVQYLKSWIQVRP
jgi:endoglucanase